MDDLIKTAHEQFRQSEESSDYNRKDFYDDFKFARLSDQWPEDIRKQRQQEGRPVLVVNKLPALIRAVVNEARQNKPSIQVSPVDSGADEDTAEVIGGLIRNIERASNASISYDTAIDHAVTGGFGFFRIDIDYAHDETFELEARIRRVPNALTVHWDTSSTEFDASDWEYAFISDLMTKDAYQARYPKGSMVQFESSSLGEDNEQWLIEDKIRVAEWFKRDRKDTDLLQLAIPTQGGVRLEAVREQDLLIMARRFFEAGRINTEGLKEKDLIEGFMVMAGVEERRRRTVEGYEVTRRIINGVEILQEDTWPGQSIPICPVWGDEVFIEGRRRFRSLIRDAKDPQAMLNFWRSQSTELVALAPKSPWVGPKGFVPKGQEQKWASSNNRSHAYLEHEGQVAPQRQPPPAVPAGVIQETNMAAMDLNDITGIYPSAIGAKSNETSGRAIMARERQGDVSNFHFIDNLNRAITYAGKVLVEIIPSVYSPKETIRILGEDEAAKVVQLTQKDGGDQNQDGSAKLYNLSIGKYDVDVKTGPNFATQREETRETLIEIMRNMPDSAAFLGDVLLDHMDFKGADKVGKRLKAMLPPEVRQMEESEAYADDPEKAALAQQNQAMQQQMQQAQQAAMGEIQKVQSELESVKRDKQADMMRAQVDAQAKQAEVQARQHEIALKARELELREVEVEAKYQLEELKLLQPMPEQVPDNTLTIKQMELSQKETDSARRDAREAERNAMDAKRLEIDEARALHEITAPPQQQPEQPREPQQPANITLHVGGEKKSMKFEHDADGNIIGAKVDEGSDD